MQIWYFCHLYADIVNFNLVSTNLLMQQQNTFQKFPNLLSAIQIVNVVFEFNIEKHSNKYKHDYLVY